jgi:hypothetical protein
VEIADRRSTVLEAFDAMDNNSVELVLLNNVNPVFSIPGGSRIAEVLSRRNRFVVAFSNFMDETSATADLIVPVQMALETWDAYESNTATLTTLQPTMGKITQAPALGDLLLNLLPPDKRPAANYKPWSAKPFWPVSTVNRHHLAEDDPKGRPLFRGQRRGQCPQSNLKAAATLKTLPGALPDPDAPGMCSWPRPPSAFSTAGAPTGPG